MKFTYDHIADAAYISLTEELVISTRQVTPNMLIDLDENDNAVGIELLFVRASGINPLDLKIAHYTADHHAAAIDLEELEAKHEKIKEIRRKRAAQSTSSD